MGFGKIFDSTFTGSMVGTGPTVFAVWSYVIANAKPPGLVELNPIILSAIIGTPIEDIERALAVLTGPDERSRTKSHNGRRLIPAGEFLYEVPTWAKYRDARNDEDRKAYNAEAQRKHRAKKKLSNHGSLTVNDSKHLSAKAEAEAEAEAEATTTLPPASLNEMALSIYSVYPRKVGRAKALTEIKKALSKVEFTELIQKVKLYAGARDGQPIKYTPHPATWFSQERYADDPAGWTESEPEPAGDPQVPDRTNELPDCNDNELALKAMWKTTMEAEP